MKIINQWDFLKGWNGLLSLKTIISKNNNWIESIKLGIDAESIKLGIDAMNFIC